MSKKAVMALAILGATGLAYRQAQADAERELREFEQFNAQLAKQQGSKTGDLVERGLFELAGWAFDSFTGGESGSQSGTSGFSWEAATAGLFGGSTTDFIQKAGFNMFGSSWGAMLKSDLQRDFGFTGYQAAGIVGNLDHESDGFRALQEYDPLVDGSRGGYGIAQWTGPRRREFEAWAAARGLELSSYGANYGFLKHEMTNTWEKRVVPAVKKTRTVEEATRVFSELYLRPGIVHMTSRLEAAARWA